MDVDFSQVRVSRFPSGIAFPGTAGEDVAAGTVVWVNWKDNGRMTKVSSVDQLNGHSFLGVTLTPARKGEQVQVAAGGMDLNLGPVLQRGQTYVLSETSGKFRPIGDKPSHKGVPIYLTYVGYAVTDSVLRLSVHATGVSRMVLQAFRQTIVTGDDLRDFTIAWERGGFSPGTFSVDPPGSGAYEYNPSANLTPSQFSRGVWFPPDTTPGDYTIYWGDTELPVTVVSKPVPDEPDVLVEPGDSVDEVESALQAGSKVILKPGLHRWDRAIDLTGISGAEVEGYGAVVRRIRNGDYGERMFVNGDGHTFRGITFQGIWMVLHTGAVGNVAFGDCVFQNCQPGYSMSGDCVFRDCRFEGGWVEYAPNGLFLRCRFRNNLFSHAFRMIGPCVGKMAMVDCHFEHTDRGPVLWTNFGEISDNLFAGTICFGIQRTENGSEIFMSEGSQPFDRNLIVFTRVMNCRSSVIQFWDTPARDNRVVDLVQEGGSGIWMAGGNGAEVSGNVVEEFELIGGGVRFGVGDTGELVSGNVVRNGTISGRVLSRGNQNFGDYRNYDMFAENRVVYAESAVPSGANLLQSVDFVDLPKGIIPWDGVEAVDCRVYRGGD